MNGRSLLPVLAVQLLLAATAEAQDSLALRARDGVAIDTVWHLDISQLRWSRPLFHAVVGADGGNCRTAGTSTARRDSSARWGACVGARISMREPTLTLVGVKGLVRLRADFGALRRAGRGVGAGQNP